MSDNNWDSEIPRGPSVKSFLVGAYVSFATLCLMIAAWVTHVYVCLREESWGFLIAGAIFFPVAIVHGVLVWLGLV